MFHLLPLSVYSQGQDPITTPTLETDGFVHCSADIATTLAVANAFYADAEEQMVAVELDPAKLTAAVRWEAADPAPPAGIPASTLFPHVYGPLDRSAVTGVYYARREVSGRYSSLRERGRTAAEFDLLPHPEGGWFRRTWASEATVEAPGSRGSRPTATAIYFLLDAGETSAWHTVASDELWFWHQGGPVTLALGGRGDSPLAEPTTVTLDARRAPQVVVPAGTWQRAHAEVETLVSCVVSPGFDFADFRTL